MKAQDLRIGNLVEYNRLYLPVSSIKSPKPLNYERYADKWIVELFDGASWIDCTMEEIQPIELTEEWLFKMSFEKDGKYYYKGSFHYHEFGHVFIGNDHVSSGNVDSNIKYIHELQNLYYALKKEELTIK